MPFGQCVNRHDAYVLKRPLNKPLLLFILFSTTTATTHLPLLLVEPHTDHPTSCRSEHRALPLFCPDKHRCACHPRPIVRVCSRSRSPCNTQANCFQCRWHGPWRGRNQCDFGLRGIATPRSLAASPLAYATLQFSGCAYLIYLGIATFCSSTSFPISQRKTLGASKALASAAQGFIVETANPKAILFYASLVPQFADPSLGNLHSQFLVLGGTFVVLQVAWDITLMLVVQRISSITTHVVSSRFQRIANRTSGAIFVALGIALLFQEQPTSAATAR